MLSIFDKNNIHKLKLNYLRTCSPIKPLKCATLDLVKSHELNKLKCSNFYSRQLIFKTIDTLTTSNCSQSSITLYLKINWTNRQLSDN